MPDFAHESVSRTSGQDMENLAYGAGDFEALVTNLYRELRRMAAGILHGKQDGRTLQPTDLVHEAYLRLHKSGPEWESRAHFFGAAARAMRQVLVEHARRRQAEKRGGGARRVTFHDLRVAAPEPDVDLVALDGAMQALASVGARLTRIMELRYFAGLTNEEIAALFNCSVATVKRDVTYARAWLQDYLNASSAVSTEQLPNHH